MSGRGFALSRSCCWAGTRLFWGFVVGGLAIPIALVSLPFTRNVPGIVVASSLVVVAMWLKRFLIVVPSMAAPMMPVGWGAYWPSRVEIAITLAAVAAVPLMLMLFFRIFPILSIYEMEEIAEHEETENVRRHRRGGVVRDARRGGSHHSCGDGALPSGNGACAG
jgi:molybdopterin-containing oxidoreductase family membrane subunit